MEELYEYLKRKREEMHRSGVYTVTIEFEEFAKIYELVCYMKQIKSIANGFE